MELPKTFDQFMEKFGGKEAKYFYNNYNLSNKFYLYLRKNFENLLEEEKLRFTVEQAEKIKNDEFIVKNFHFITFSEVNFNRTNANENLSRLANNLPCIALSELKFNRTNANLIRLCEPNCYLNEFFISYFKNSNHDSVLSEFMFEYVCLGFNEEKIELMIKYKDFFPFDVNDFLKRRYNDFKCKDFFWAIQQNPKDVFDYLGEKNKKLTSYPTYSNGLMRYLYIHMKPEEQTPERFGLFNDIDNEHLILSYLNFRISINFTEEHLALVKSDYYRYYLEIRLKKTNDQTNLVESGEENNDRKKVQVKQNLSSEKQNNQTNLVGNAKKNNDDKKFEITENLVFEQKEVEQNLSSEEQNNQTNLVGNAKKDNDEKKFEIKENLVFEQKHNISNFKGERGKENKSNKICEGIGLFFASLVSLVSVFGIVIGATAAVGLLALAFTPWILIGIGVPVLASGGYFFSKSIKNLRNLNSISESNQSLKEETNDTSIFYNDENEKSDFGKPGNVEKNLSSKIKE